MRRRKLQGISKGGKDYLFFYIPFDISRDHKLKKGDSVKVIEKENSLEIIF